MIRFTEVCIFMMCKAFNILSHYSANFPEFTIFIYYCKWWPKKADYIRKYEAENYCSMCCNQSGNDKESIYASRKIKIFI